jgi:RNA polymerase sigma-70 factor (ECF subfamily)
MRGLSDADALRRSLAEPSRFAAVYERHLVAVHDYLRRRVGDGAAEDLAAEVFVRAFRGRSRYGVQYDTALPWLLGIATNVIGDHRRTETRRLAVLEQVVTAAEGSVSDLPHTGLDAVTTHALRRLRAPDRDALLLVVWGELSYEEAARALSVPIGTIRSRVARARRRLAGDLHEEPITHSISGPGEDHA